MLILNCLNWQCSIFDFNITTSYYKMRCMFLLLKNVWRKMKIFSFSVYISTLINYCVYYSVIKMILLSLLLLKCAMWYMQISFLFCFVLFRKSVSVKVISLYLAIWPIDFVENCSLELINFT